MATFKRKSTQLASPTVISEDKLLEVGQDFELDDETTLTSWITAKTAAWRQWRDSNYSEQWSDYEATYRGEFVPRAGQKTTQRSKIVSPASQQAVELCAAELEEAVFGRGDYFEILPGIDGSAEEATLVKAQLRGDLDKAGFHRSVSEAMVNAAIYGTGIVELVLTEKDQLVPTLRSVGHGVMAVGTIKEANTLVVPRSVHPRNFLIDPAAASLADALGVAIEEYVPMHMVELEQQKGNYKKTTISASSGDDELNVDSFTDEYSQDKVKRLRYYGLVPKHLLLEEPCPEHIEYVEAVVVIANDTALLKAEETPYMMGDRPVEAFQLDFVPGTFWGMGLMEKAKNGQEALDAELRARIDSLAFVNSPMMAMDATKIPRGAKMDVFPGKLWLTQGNPAETFRDFKFGQLDGNTWQQADYLERMISQATGAVNPADIARGVGDGRTGAVSMIMSGIVKRYKRYAMNLFDQLLVPLIQGTLWRYMQFEPKRYPVQNYKATIASGLGIMAKEFEQIQMIQVLQGLPPEATAARSALLSGIVSNSSFPQKAQVLQALDQPTPLDMASMQQQENPMIQQLQLQQAEVTLQLDIAEKQARIRKLNAEADLATAKAIDVSQDNRLEALKLATKGLYAVDKEDQSAEFDRRYKLAQLTLKEKDINVRREIADKQVEAAWANEPKQAPLAPVQSPAQFPSAPL